MDNDLRKAITSIKAGDKISGQRLLTQLLKANPNNETAWLWMTAVLDDPQQRKICLQNVLQINPNNELAKRGIAQIEVKPTKIPESEDIILPQFITSQQAETLPGKQFTESIDTAIIPDSLPIDVMPVNKKSTRSTIQPSKIPEVTATKKCPYCAEMIQAEANVCRFCGRNLANQTQKGNLSKKKNNSELAFLLVLIGAIAFGCGLYDFIFTRSGGNGCLYIPVGLVLFGIGLSGVQKAKANK